MQTSQAGEAMRQESVKGILGYPEMAARTGLYGAQEELARAQADEAAHPERAQQRAVTLEMIKKLKTPEEIAQIKANTALAVSAGTLNETQAKQINELLDVKKQAEATNNRLLAAQADEYLSVLLPAPGGTQEATGRTRDVLSLMASQAGAGETPANVLAKQKLDIQKEQTATEVEQKILEKPSGPEALSRYQDFNQYSNRPRVAVNNSGKIKLISLPKVNGKVITARQVYAAAAAKDMSVEEFLVKILKVPEAIKMFKNIK